MVLQTKSLRLSRKRAGKLRWGLTLSVGADFEQSSCSMGPGHKAQLKGPTWWVTGGICSLPACHMRIHPDGKCQKMSQVEGSFLCLLASRQPLERGLRSTRSLFQPSLTRQMEPQNWLLVRRQRWAQSSLGANRSYGIRITLSSPWHLPCF